MGERKEPLVGIRILDLTQLYPGPLASMMLADLGAEVIRIEHPNSLDKTHYLPPFLNGESAAYLSLNRSKRSLALDLKQEEGRRVFFDLVETADLVLEQFRPSVIDKMGIGYREAIKHNPKIIYLSLTGFGQNGPYANKAGHDINYISWAGLLSEIREDSRPVLPAFQIADVAGGCYVAIIACLAALWYREKSGKGQEVDVAMVDSVLPLLTLQLAQYWGSSEASPALDLLNGSMPCYGVYACSDGKYVSLGAIETKFWENFCKFLKKEEWLSSQLALGEDGERIRKQIAAVMREKTRGEWLKMAAEHDMCMSPVNELKDLEKDPHLKSRRMIIEIEQRKGHWLKGIGIPIKFSKSKPGEPKSAPRVGEDSIEILREIGYSADQISDLIKDEIVYDGHKG